MNISYIAVLDYEHMDNGLFLKTFANALSKHEDRGLIVHSDSLYTDRIMQTGVMREDARIRAIKDLNNRLVALFADDGISAIGLNGYQRELISISKNDIRIDVDQLERLPREPVLLISSLIYSVENRKPMPVSLAKVVESLQNSLQIRDTFLFTRSDTSEIIKKELPETLKDADDREKFLEEFVPQEFRNADISAKLISANDFGNHPNLKNYTVL